MALWSFFFGKQAVENVHHTPAHPRLIGQDIEAAGRCIERWKTRRALDHRTAFGTGPSAARHNYFQQYLRIVDFGRQSKHLFANSQIDTILDAQ